MDTIRSVLVPIHREGWKFIAIFAVVTLVLFWVAEPLGWLGVILTCWCAYFFRDPPRVTPVRDGLLISPADGVVQMIERAAPPEELGMGSDPRQRISVFMNVFDVHVNRTPAEGTVTTLAYRPGKFLNAALDKASTDNERQSMRLKLKNGKEIEHTMFAFLVEDDDKVADRHAIKKYPSRRMSPLAVKDSSAINFTLFSYMIGNTDWSLAYQHNTEMFFNGKKLVAVPYDFDHSGLVNAYYAKPNPMLKISSVTERIYRGLCRRDPEVFTNLRKLYISKEEIIFDTLA